jgi:hypothetical protein
MALTQLVRANAGIQGDKLLPPKRRPKIPDFAGMSEAREHPKGKTSVRRHCLLHVFELLADEGRRFR